MCSSEPSWTVEEGRRAHFLSFALCGTLDSLVAPREELKTQKPLNFGSVREHVLGDARAMDLATFNGTLTYLTGSIALDINMDTDDDSDVNDDSLHWVDEYG